MDNYTSLKELYMSLLPSFKVKLRLIKKTKYNNLTKKDIWNYLQDTKWKYDNNLTISDMTSDIINVSEEEIEKYRRNKNEEEY